MRTAVLAAPLAALLLAVACAPRQGGTSGVEPRDTPAAPPPSVTGSLPHPVEGPPLWTAPFSSEPRAAGSSFVGVSQERAGGPLHFLGVDRDGVTRWATERDPSCTGFTVARAEEGGDEFVVLLDREPDPDGGVLAHVTTASAHDPDTGELRWGPTEVPGTLVGPGLVFAAVAGSVMSEETGPRTALAATTGEVVADEDDGDAVLHEHHGTLLLHRDGALRAVGPGGEGLWTHADLAVPDPLGDRPVAAGYGPRPSSDSSSAVVLEWTADPAERGEEARDALLYTVHHLRTGARLLTLDPGTRPRLLGDGRGRTVVLGTPAAGGEARLYGLAATEPAPVWELPARPGERLAGLVGGTLYTDVPEGGTGRAVDAATGDVPAELPTEVADRIPVAALPGGPALLQVPEGGGGALAALPVS
ncbi:PQQ-binding-like beta-propeller repeat protein [Nocardiopsis eucommiae]|uniref:PQQ-binding-like beta-propeller repeat protein n=1 Tax=Nocardiopsis eucommiae TaxID=2831970 RepID=UPI003D718F4E